ncbi:MAG: MarR family transcriptional regulator [Chloroflexota bacterium]
MSSQENIPKTKREGLLQAVTNAIYESSTTAVFFHTAIAEQIGLGATEEKTLLILSGLGSLTAGEIAQHTGLTTASVTSLIDRLESKGFVRRVRDTKDRRRVIVEPDAARLAELAQLFGSLQGTFDDLLGDYTDEQLATITDYLTRAAQRSREAIEALRQRSTGDGAKP